MQGKVTLNPSMEVYEAPKTRGITPDTPKCGFSAVWDEIYPLKIVSSKLPLKTYILEICRLFSRTRKAHPLRAGVSSHRSSKRPLNFHLRRQ